uniref:Uncharacterized protein n=1 Tax=viral metagenome TaxID=1070528 RepID=A0A6C0HCN9_9ZZZZ
MTQNLGVIIVDKTGSLKSLTIKDYKEEELYKKCGFKKPDGFDKQTEWKIKMDGKKYLVAAYGKSDGKANMENKYDFPPPIDTTLFFGSCLLLGALLKDDGKKEPFSLTLEIWEKMYEKLFGGFEDLATTAVEDEAEEDELEGVPANKKTKDGYLKDGFVVDSDSDDKDAEYETDSDDDDEDSDEDEDSEEVEDIGEIVLEDIGSELSEESYSDEEDE